MASLIPGYQYDIFISYRQKDNKHDGWVTDFVNDLKGELESTFKEEVSLYFDINPHDGLTEIHDVSASLKEKLRCLIFIPVISRTYCDPKSFAWENEFKAFIEQASGDGLGLKVKLPNGNIASRVLPVIIHELNAADIRVCETVLSGVLRGIEFIYKAPGVNRPLRAKEDHPNDNLNKLYYRDQVNKVANGIEEIISGLKNVQLVNAEKEISGDVSSHAEKPVSKSISSQTFSEPVDKDVVHLKDIKQKTSRKIYAYSSSLIIIGFLVLFVFTSGSTLPFSRRDWVLVTDFENMTGDSLFDNSLYTAFTLSTSQSRYINVFPRARIFETLTRMKITGIDLIDEKTGREIAEREGIGIYIVPAISKAGNSFAVAARIMDTGTGNQLKSEVLYAESQDEILDALDKLSRKTRRDLGESRYSIAVQDKPLSQVTTSSLEALKIYSAGIDRHIRLDFNGARDAYEAALRIDTGFTSAKASLGNILIERFDAEKGREMLNQALNSINNLTEREKLGILAFYAFNVEKDNAKGIKYSIARLELYPDDAAAHNNLGWYYQNSGEYTRALKEYKEAVRINRHLAITYGGIVWIYLDMIGDADSALVWSGKMIEDNPENAWGYMNLGASWFCLDSLSMAENAYLKAMEISPDLIINLYRLAHTYRKQERFGEAIAILNKILITDKNELSAYYDLGVNYQAAGNVEKARENFMKFKDNAANNWVKMWPDNPATYTSIAAVTARLGEMDLSGEMLQKATGLDSTLHEKFAEILCIQGNLEKALNELGKAFESGYRDLFRLKMTPDFEALKYDIRYRRLLEHYFKN